MDYDRISPARPIYTNSATVQLQPPQSLKSDAANTSARLPNEAPPAHSSPQSQGRARPGLTSTPRHPGARAAPAPAWAPPGHPLNSDSDHDTPFSLRRHVIITPRFSPDFSPSTHHGLEAPRAVSLSTPGAEPAGHHSLHAISEGSDLVSLASSHFPNQPACLDLGCKSFSEEDLFGSLSCSPESSTNTADSRMKRPVSWPVWPTALPPNEAGALGAQLPFLPGLVCPNIMTTYWMEQRTLVYQLDACGVTVCRRKGTYCAHQHGVGHCHRLVGRVST